MLVVFLLSTFSASGEITLSTKNVELPKAIHAEDLKRAPIISITRDTISFTASDISTDVSTTQAIDDDSGAARLTDLQDLLVKVKEDTENQCAEQGSKAECTAGFAILQADKGISAKVVNKVITTAHQAGYPNVMFVVSKSKK